ncbi:MAG: type I methionyl aminopeptidase, partial [Corynebacterium casei]|nr:type I methionyl aminopeptidase [Corynebacterium casei]
MSTREKLKPGKPTPVRKVPDHIERPEYVWKDTVQ